MARLQIDFFSQVLQVGTSIQVIYPERPRFGPAAAAPERPELPAVLYLLHGLSDDQTAWTRQTSIERYASAYNLVVVMPRVDRSFYANMAHGPDYWDFVARELPRFIEETFQVSTAREDTFVAGLSMGGYGALKLALAFPERFAAAASFSGAVDLAELVRIAAAGGTEPRRRRTLGLIVGHELDGIAEEIDLFSLASRLASAGSPAPWLMMTCGTDDELLPHNERLHEHLGSLGIEHAYHTEPGGHVWGLWDRHVERFLKALEESGRLLPRD